MRVNNLLNSKKKSNDRALFVLLISNFLYQFLKYYLFEYQNIDKILSLFQILVIVLYLIFAKKDKHKLLNSYIVILIYFIYLFPMLISQKLTGIKDTSLPIEIISSFIVILLYYQIVIKVDISKKEIEQMLMFFLYMTIIF